MPVTSTAGIQVQLTSSGATTITHGNPVLFDNTVSNLSTNISYSNGTFTITAAGQYNVDWWVAINSAIGSDLDVAFAVKTSQGDNIIGNSPIKTATVAGNALINITSASIGSPVTLQLVNATTNSTAGYGVTTSIRASLRITNVTQSGVAYGYVYTILTGPSRTITVGSDIPFSNNGVLVGITHTVSTAGVVVPDTADYKINYSTIYTGGSGASMALAVNGTVNTSTDIPIGSAPSATMGTAILSLNIGDTVTLRNNGSASLILNGDGIGSQLDLVKLG